MKVLLIGNGGRENAIAWKIFNSESFKKSHGKLFCTLGSPGINEFAEPVDIKPNETEKLVEFAIRNSIDLTVVGPEIPLSLGVADKFERAGLKIFGPCKQAARIETSKIFAKDLMLEHKIPTAKYKSFSKDNTRDAEDFLKDCKYPVVLKADGLAAGKGVIIANDKREALIAIESFSEDGIFGKAGLHFIIEEFLEGEEASVFVITDGEDFEVLPFSQDHKKISEGDTGKNTGGMGAIAPLKKFMNEKLSKKIEDKIIKPVLKAMKSSGNEFRGCLYIGLMINDNEPYVIEFNCRFGDPETQAVLPLIESDFLKLLKATADRDIRNYELKVNDNFTCCVVMASNGYPDKFETGKEIAGININSDNSLVFHSATRSSEENKVLSNGGRVLSIVGISEVSLEDAVKSAYERVSEIRFENAYFRKDIGFRQLAVSS